MTYQITEPHPSAAPSSRIHTGRGGAGNTYKTPALRSRNSTSRSASLDRVPTTTSTSSTLSTRFSSGRGGAGNIHPLSQAALYDFDAELQHKNTREQGHEVFHVGRGGAGNFALRKDNERKMSNESVSSTSSVRSGFFRRLSAVMDRVWYRPLLTIVHHLRFSIAQHSDFMIGVSNHLIYCS